MSNTRNTGFLTNVVKYTDKGDISFVSGSTTLMSISSSGAVTVTGVISGSNALTSSYSQNSELLDNLDSTSFVFTSSFNTYSSSMSTRVTNTESTGSTLTTASASFAVVSSSYSSASGSLSTRVTRIEGNYATTGSNVFLGAQTVCANITSTGTIIAQTLNVQQVTSSVVYSSGSNIFGCSLANTQQFTGSVTMTGSLTVTTAGTSPEFQVNSGGTIKGNALTDVHNVTGSLRITGSGNHFILGCNLLIGTTTSTLGKLEVIGSGGVRVNEDGAGTKVIQIRSDFAGVDPAINVSTNNALLLQTNNTERIRITSAGIACFACQVCSGVGFYASSVQSGITIDSTTNGDTIIASRGLSSALHGIVRTVGQNGVTCMQIISTRNTVDGNLPASVNALWGLTNHDMVIATANTERMRINSVGNVQIGTISNSTGNILEAFQNNIRITAISNGNDTAGFFMRVMSGASQVGNTTLRVNNAGTFQLYTGTSSEAMNLQITSAGISCFASTVCAPTFRGGSSLQLGGYAFQFTAAKNFNENTSDVEFFKIAMGGGQAAIFVNFSSYNSGTAAYKMQTYHGLLSNNWTGWVGCGIEVTGNPSCRANFAASSINSIATYSGCLVFRVSTTNNGTSTQATGTANILVVTDGTVPTFTQL